MYQINDDFKLKISNLCCYEFKKKPFAEWLKNNNKTVTMTGMMKSEGGVRSKIDCISMKDGKLHKFHPLAPLNSEFEKWFIRERLNYVNYIILHIILKELVVKVVLLR